MIRATAVCNRCGIEIYRAPDGAWEDSSGGCSCDYVDEHTPDSRTITSG